MIVYFYCAGPNFVSVLFMHPFIKINSLILLDCLFWLSNQRIVHDKKLTMKIENVTLERVFISHVYTFLSGGAFKGDSVSLPILFIHFKLAIAGRHISESIWLLPH